MKSDVNQEVEIVRVANGFVITFGDVSAPGFGDSFVYLSLEETLEAIRDFYTVRVLSRVEE